MKIVFDLQDEDSEVMVRMSGFDYAPPVGATVIFHDGRGAENEFDSTVIRHFYTVSENELIVVCKVNDEYKPI